MPRGAGNRCIAVCCWSTRARNCAVVRVEDQASAVRVLLGLPTGRFPSGIARAGENTTIARREDVGVV